MAGSTVVMSARVSATGTVSAIGSRGVQRHWRGLLAPQQRHVRWLTTDLDNSKKGTGGSDD